MTDPSHIDLEAPGTRARSAGKNSTDSPIRICSIRDAARILNRPVAQIQWMSGAHLLGDEFSTRSGATYHLESRIDELARARRLNKADFLRIVQLSNGDAPVVILRQGPPHVTESPERGWYGYSRLADRSADPLDRLAQDNASRMYWPVTNLHQEKVQEAAARGLTIPLVISVGGWIASCREITGIDAKLSSFNAKRVAFTVRPAGAWASDVTDCWLSSGAGKAILWWHAGSK